MQNIKGQSSIFVKTDNNLISGMHSSRFFSTNNEGDKPEDDSEKSANDAGNEEKAEAAPVAEAEEFKKQIKFGMLGKQSTERRPTKRDWSDAEHSGDEGQGKFGSNNKVGRFDNSN